MFAAFSKAASHRMGSSYYTTPSGAIAEVTTVWTDDPGESWREFYKWEDAEWVGEVTEYRGEAAPRVLGKIVDYPIWTPHNLPIGNEADPMRFRALFNGIRRGGSHE